MAALFEGFVLSSPFLTPRNSIIHCRFFYLISEQKDALLYSEVRGFELLSRVPRVSKLPAGRKICTGAWV